MQFVPLKGRHSMLHIITHFTTTKTEFNEQQLPSSSHGTPHALRQFRSNQVGVDVQASSTGYSDILLSEPVFKSSCDDVSGVYLIAPQQTGDDRMMRAKVPHFKHANTTEKLENFKPLMPLALVTLDDDQNRYLVSSRVVVDYGEGVLEEVDTSDRGSGQLANRTLSSGAHAFVRCYGESFLRCTLDSFEFGCAGGHPLLASFSQVLMAGEIEVDEAGVLTRWLNKSGLYMPPKFLMGQSGLPFAMAWVYVSEEEVSRIDPLEKAKLVESGSLVNIAAPKAFSDALSSPTLTAAAIAPLTKESSTLPSLSSLRNSTPQTRASTHIGPSVHASDSWILKANDDMVWQPTISTSAYHTAKEAVARFNILKRRLRQKNSSRLSKISPATSPMTSRVPDQSSILENDESKLGAENMRSRWVDEEGVRISSSMEESSSIEYELEEERKVLAKIKAIKREMIAAGVFDAHRQGATERAQRKSELGFSKTLQLYDP